ncbi:hypothetical protein C0995_016572, partial [Termitomyces sp. Mi166
VVDEEEFKILQPPQIPGWHVTIKEEALERIVPADAENLQVIARRIPLVDSWNEHVNYQRMRNQDLRLQGRSLIDNQGVVFEGHSGVMPIDNMRRQFVTRQERQECKEHPNNSGDSRKNNDRNERRCGQHDRKNGDDGRPPERCPERPEPRKPPAPHEERKAEELLHLVTRAWSLPSPHDLHATTPGMNMAVKLHMDHMHDCLNCLVDDWHGLSTGQKPVQGPTSDTLVTKENQYAPRAGQPVQKGWNGLPQVNPPRVSPPKVALGGDAGYKPSAATARCYNCG